MQTTLVDKLVDFLEEPQNLPTIYQQFPEEKQSTIFDVS